ncbi:MAG: two-component system VirA-like sensor kinase [Tardiphaga sp.]
MKVARWALAVIVLSVLLTWCSWRALNPEAEIYDRALIELDGFTMAEDALYRDLFTARTGLLRNYDPLVREIDALHSAIARLRATASVDKQTGEVIDRLSASVDRQDELVENFKSQNAVLHNSLSFFGRFVASSDRHDLEIAISAAGAAILHLTLDTSPTAVKEVEQRLDELDRQAARFDEASVLEPFLAHGRLLQKVLPSVDHILKMMMTLPFRNHEDALRAMIVDAQVASRDSARNFRTVLYGSSIALMAFLVHLGIRLRSRANALIRRAALEHIIADISMNFINATPQGIDAEIQRAITAFGTFAGSDRVYVVVSGATTRSYLWHQPGREFPAGWPEGALDLAARMGVDETGVVHVPDVRRMPAGENRSFMEGLGLGGWACAMNIDHRGCAVAFGFDAVNQKCRVAHPGELVLLRMTLDTFIHAIERQGGDEERNRLQKRVEQARRMERIGTFTSGIAHNFNNILGGILGYTEVMEEHAGASAALMRHLAGIRRSAERARDLVSQILMFGRRRENRRTPLSIGAQVAEAVSLLRVALPSRIEIVIRQHPEGLIVVGEGVQLQQVIMNLCNNAANAIPDSGRIEIEIELQEVLTPICLSHDKIEAGQYVRISVSDTGEGMDGATLDRIFEPFFTTRSSGNGLGLATVRDIVLDHGGGIDVRSCRGEGSRFDVWLPRAAAIFPGQRPPVRATGQGKVVMLVASDHHRLLGDEEMLAALGFEAVGFATAEAAREASKATPERFDLVVIGHVGSFRQSLELATVLNHELTSVPIVLATRATSEIGADAMLAAGISDVVRWPIVAEEIAIVLSQISAPAARGLKVSDIGASLRYQADSGAG